MLEALDTTTAIGRVYTALVAHPHATAAQVVLAVALDEREVRQALSTLRAMGLVTQRDDVSPRTWEAESPDRKVDDALDMARKVSHQLSRLHWMARRETERYPGLEVIRDPTQIREQYRMMINMAAHEVRSLNRPPFLTGGDEGAIRSQINEQEASVRIGVVYKAIWWDGLFDDPEASSIAMATMANGEQARILADLPMKLIIVDDQRAMLPLDPTDLTDGATLVIHPSGLLTALNSVFDTLWGLSAPILGAVRSPELTEQERSILTLMVAGASDDAIGRRLGISRRTVVRHTAALLERLGAKTRFQAGAQAVRRGWL
jgi:DNA-binding CsgD family transcriptional regulator